MQATALGANRSQNLYRPAARAHLVIAYVLSAPLLIRSLCVIDLLMGVLYFLSRRLRHIIPSSLVNFLDLNRETNLPSWYSALQLALIGGILVAFAASQIRRGVRAAWAVMCAGLAFLFLSLDETTSLHENFSYWLDTFQHRRDTLFNETGFWMLICAPVFLATLALLGFGAVRYLRGRKAIIVKFAVGAAIFVAATAGMEALSNFVAAQTTAARVLILLEEVGEMLGATVMLWAVCDLVRSHGVRLLALQHDDER
jgi:hypothetical protein